MATTARPTQVVQDDVIVLHKVAWDTYERLLEDDEGRRVPRMTFDRGVLELVTPSLPHEKDADKIAYLVKVVADTINLSIESTRSTTFTRKDLRRGFEADASFYIANEEVVRGKQEVNLGVDPPPDLVLEMEHSRSAINKLALFASMGIPEVWRCDGHHVTIHVLDGARYRESATSSVFPVFTSEILTRFLESSRTLRGPEWFRTVTEWAQSQRS